jgi:hypothetical protein
MLCFGLWYGFKMCCCDEVSGIALGLTLIYHLSTYYDMVKTWHNGQHILRQKEMARREWHDSGTTVARQWGQESIIWNDPQNVIDHICINICVTVRRLPCDLDFSVGLRNLLQTHAQSQPLNSSAACIGTVFDSCVISVLM